MLAARLLALAVASVALSAQSGSNRDQDWQALQNLADKGFAQYQAEYKALPGQHDQLRRARLDTFNVASHRMQTFIATYYPPQKRNSAQFIFVLFTYALYHDLSGDLWHARTLYKQVCDETASKLVANGIAVPKYRNASILSLCLRKLDELTYLDIGPPPTHTSIAQSTGDADPADFLEALGEKPSIISEHIDAGDPDAIIAMAQVDDALRASPDCKNSETCAAEKTAAILAAERKLGVEVRKGQYSTVIGIAVPGAQLDPLAAAIDRTVGSYFKTFGPDRLQHFPFAVTILGKVSDEDEAFFKIAYDQSSGLLVVGPQGFVGRPKQMQPSDYPLIAGHRVEAPGASIRSLDVAMLEVDGTGPFAVGNGKYLIGLVASITDSHHVLPGFDCPDEMPALRFCALQDGLFGRYLASLPDRSVTAPRSVLAGLAAQERTSGGDEGIAVVEQLSGLSRDALERGFRAYLDKAASANAGGTGLEKAAEELRAAFAKR